MDDATRFQRLVQFRVPDSFSDAIDAAASKRLTTKSEYVRQTLLRELRLDGFELAATAPRDAGSLYNVTADGLQWALVTGETIRAWHRSHDRPADEQGGIWLPVEYRDSEPFDPALHWRGTPETRNEGDKVTRTYPVIIKSLEAM
jgi:hypothetical protein